MSAMDRGNSGGDARRDRRAAASVTLRQVGAREAGSHAVGDMLDPAAKSLADALRITYRLLQAAMLVIVVIYLASGFQSIKESERGLRLLFGKIQNDAPLTSGFQFAAPEPIGELVHVSTGEVELNLTRDFFPNLTKDDEEKLLKDGTAGLVNPGTNVLDPDADGMLLTSDGNIVHARVKMTYRRERPGDFARNVAEDAELKPNQPSIETRIVTSAARRGMICATANVSMDEFLKNQPDPGRKNFRPVDEAAKETAQKALDAIGSGISIQQFSVLTRTPPRFIISDFNRVQASQSEASKSIQEAQGYRRDTLNKAAGEAAELLLTRLDEYERQFEAGKADEAARTLGTVHSMMLNEAIVGGAGGGQVAPGVFGLVSQAISEADQYRTQTVARARADADLFVAKRGAYQANPSVFVATEWTDAMRTLLGRQGVQIHQFPDTLDRTVIMINRDPEIEREQLNARQTREADEAAKRRIQERTKEQLERRFDPAGG